MGQIVDGQPVNAAVNNAANMSRTTDTDTLGKLGLNNVDVVSGASIANAQRAINKAFESSGITSETDITVNTYSSSNYVTTGDSKKVAVGKLDTQLFTTQTEVTGHETRLTNIESNTFTFAGNKTFSGNVEVDGNLLVTGVTTTINSTTLDVADKNITVNKGGNDATAEGAGITVDRTGTDGSLIYKDTSGSKFACGPLSAEADIVNVSATQTLTNKTLTSPVINTPTGITKSDVGLGNVDNTSDATKNAAVATLTNKTLTSPVINNPTGITKSDVGLGNVDNTSDATKNSAAVSLTNHTINGSLNTITNVSLTTGVTGTLPIANGGTNAVTANAALNNLLPTQTGNATKYLQTDGTNTSWQAVASTTVLDSIFDIQNLTVNNSVAASAMTIALKTKATTDATAGDPIKIGTRSATLTSGAYNIRSVTGALSIVIPSGATLNHASGQNHPIFLYAIDNAGTIELAVSQSLFNESVLVSTTAISAGATSGITMYSTSARSNVACRLLATLISNQTTAGTYAAVATNVILGNAGATLAQFVPKMRYDNSAGTSITSTSTAVTFATKIEDNRNMYSGGTVTIPETGNYQVTAAAVTATTSFGVAGGFEIDILVNGATTIRIANATQWSAISASQSCHSDIGYAFTAGDTIVFKLRCSTTTSLITAAGFNYISVAKVA